MTIEQTVQIFDLLMQVPHSRIELALRSGATPKFVGKVLQEMKAQKMIYVISYSNESDGRNRVKIYALGQGEDAQPRSSQPQEARSRKSYVKKVQARKIANIKTTFVKGVPLWQ
jgi:hypothetical protein